MQTSYERPVSGAASAPGTAYFVVFRIDEQRYGISMENVERVVRAFAPAPLPKGPSAVSGLLNIHGRLIPLLNLRHIFGLPEKELTPQDYFIIAAGPKGACAIAADHVPGLTSCGPDELAGADAAVRGEYVDRAIKARGGLILIFDPRRLPPHEVPGGASPEGGAP